MAATETEREEFEPGGEARLPEEDVTHPGPRQYVMVGLVLAGITALEVALFYMDFLPSPVVVASLLILMTLKFGLVVLWFMHLKFDSRTYSRFFVMGLAFAITLYGVVLLTFGAFTRG
jgi:cytochrome c oxidase subunit IV